MWSHKKTMNVLQVSAHHLVREELVEIDEQQSSKASIQAV
jgi:hypothetical protein